MTTQLPWHRRIPVMAFSKILSEASRFPVSKVCFICNHRGGTRATRMDLQRSERMLLQGAEEFGDAFELLSHEHHRVIQRLLDSFTRKMTTNREHGRLNPRHDVGEDLFEDRLPQRVPIREFGVEENGEGMDDPSLLSVFHVEDEGADNEMSS